MAQVIILLIFTMLVGALQSNLRIIGGKDVEKNEFPFMVSLQNNGQHICGGTVINQEFILTAAHCVCNKKVNNELEIIIASYNLSEGDRLPVKQIICHDYDPIEKIKDVALLRLKYQIPKYLYLPVFLANYQYKFADNTTGTLIGWGRTSTNGEASEILQKADVTIYQNSTCSKSFNSFLNIVHHICVGWSSGARGSCQGDSGGPLLIGKVQIGIISFGTAKFCEIGNEEKPKVSARISNYIGWIRKYAGEIYIYDGQDNKNCCSYSKVTYLILLIPIMIFILDCI